MGVMCSFSALVLLNKGLPSLSIMDNDPILSTSLYVSYMYQNSLPGTSQPSSRPLSTRVPIKVYLLILVPSFLKVWLTVTHLRSALSYLFFYQLLCLCSFLSKLCIIYRPMVDVSDSETRKCRVHVSECVTRK